MSDQRFRVTILHHGGPEPEMYHVVPADKIFRHIAKGVQHGQVDIVRPVLLRGVVPVRNVEPVQLAWLGKTSSKIHEPDTMHIEQNVFSKRRFHVQTIRDKQAHPVPCLHRRFSFLPPPGSRDAGDNRSASCSQNAVRRALEAKRQTKVSTLRPKSQRYN